MIRSAATARLLTTSPYFSIVCAGDIVARKIDFNNPDVLLYVRIAYVATQVVVLGVYFYTASIVRRLPSAFLPRC